MKTSEKQKPSLFSFNRNVKLTAVNAPVNGYLFTSKNKIQVFIFNLN